MKNQNGKLGVWLFLMVFLLSRNVDGQSNAQDIDQQWYVKNSNIDAGNIVIKEFGTPNTKCNLNAADDLFIIFKDGSYFNSRPNRINNDTNYFRFDGENLHFTTDKPIQYLYATNVYDDDPPPARVAKTSTQSTNQNLINKSISSTRYTKAIYANHNVKPGSDITLIINKDSVGGSENDITIYANTLIKKVNGQYEIVVVNDPNQTLTPSNIFNESYILNGIEYIYYNFRASASLTDSLETIDYITDSLFLKISVESKKGKFELIELVSAAHDPNFIRFDTSCNKEVWSCLGKDSVNYEIYQVHFYNASKEPACSLACRLKLPSHLNINSAKVINPIINGYQLSPESIKIELIDGLLLATFPTDSCIRTCDASLPNSGHVDFYIVAERLERAQIDNQSLSGVTIFNKGSDIEKEYELLFRKIWDIKNTDTSKIINFQQLTTSPPNCENLPDGFPMCLIIMGATAAAAVAGSTYLRKLKADREALKNLKKEQGNQ